MSQVLSVLFHILLPTLCRLRSKSCPLSSSTSHYASHFSLLMFAFLNFGSFSRHFQLTTHCLFACPHSSHYSPLSYIWTCEMIIINLLTFADGGWKVPWLLLSSQQFNFAMTRRLCHLKVFIHHCSGAAADHFTQFNLSFQFITFQAPAEAQK